MKPDNEDPEPTRSVLDQLIEASRLYTRSRDFKELLDFAVRLRNFAPFNAMLLQIQKPGLSYAASALDWRTRFGRQPKEGARPLLIMWPFGPVALVYDVMDTEGDALPEDVNCFVTHGFFDKNLIRSIELPLKRKNISMCWVDEGDASAGLIRIHEDESGSSKDAHYRLQINRNHDHAVQFATACHELGHLFLGHLGSNQRLHIPERANVPLDIKEIEAESVAYIICGRNGIELKSQRYLSQFVNRDTSIEQLDIYQIMKAAGKVEAAIGLMERTRFPQSR